MTAPSGAAPTVWELDGVTCRFGAGPLSFAPAFTALDGASLRVAQGERVALIGDSGCGKTTLARVGLGLVRKDAGVVRLFGEDVSSWSSRRWLEARHQAQLLFQDPRSMLNPGMRIGRLLEESAAIHRPESDRRREAARVLDDVGLGDRAGAFPHELSGGEQRRAGIARVLLARPRLVVADEPTAGLDAALKAGILELLLERLGRQCAIVLISHDLPVVAWACERILVMNAGRIVDGFPSTAPVASHPATARLLAASGLGATA
jgi:ABC-type glutathione transport system ATPase component